MSGILRATGHKMKRFLLLPAAVMLGLTSASTVPAQAGGGDVAAGLLGGLAAGTIIGAAVTAPRYYGPPPVYVAPAPYCYWTIAALHRVFVSLLRSRPRSTGRRSCGGPAIMIMQPVNLGAGVPGGEGMRGAPGITGTETGSGAGA